MSILLSAWLLVLRRSAANWQLLCSIVVGVVTAVTLLASTPIYATALDDLGLSYTLRKQDINAMNVQVHAYYYPLQGGEYDRLAATLHDMVDDTLGWMTRQTVRYGKSASFYVFKEGQPTVVERSTPRGYFQFSSGMEEHVSVVEGRLPKAVAVQSGAPSDQPPELEVVLSRKTAEDLKVKLGDKLDFMAAAAQQPIHLPVLIVGIVEPIDIQGPYWAGNNSRFAERTDDYIIVPSFVPEPTLFGAVAEMVPRLEGDYSWYLLLDIGKINTRNAAQVEESLLSLRSQLKSSVPGSTDITLLDLVLRDYQSKLFFLTVPLFLIIVQIVGIVLYYLVMVASMLVERQAGEMALLKSRGGSTRQVIAIHAMESIVICGIAAIVGPPLAMLLTGLLGKTPPFMPLTQGEMLAATLQPSAFALAVGAAGLCFAALLLPAFQSARMGIIQYKLLAARPPRTPWWQRYYLDLILLGLGAILYWELRERGTFVSRGVFGDLSADPLLLVSPALFVMAIAAIFLRLFPIAMNLLSRTLMPFVKAPVALGLYQMVRNPVHYTRLILLLMLTTSMGIFFATFGGTLDRSYKERALYKAGADLRAEGLRLSADEGKESLVADYAAISGVTGVSPAFRAPGRVGSSRFGQDYTLLAVEPSTFASLTWYREDFSRHSLGDLMKLLEQDRVGGEGKEIPGQPDKIGIWAMTTDPRLPLVLYIRLKDSKGLYHDYPLGNLDRPDWRYLEVSLSPQSGQPPLPYPLRIHSLYLRNSSGYVTTAAAAVFLDDLQAISQEYAGGSTLLEDFEDVSDWAVLQEGAQPSSDTFELSSEAVRDGKGAGKFVWSSRRAFGVRGIRVQGEDRPLNVIASTSFLKASGRSIGDKVSLSVGSSWVPAVIRDSIDLFPTLDPTEGGFVIANLDRLLYSLNQVSWQDTYPNEMWMSLAPDPAQRAEAVSALNGKQFNVMRIYDLDSILSSFKSDPLIAAGWGGVLFIAFLASLILSSIGFLVYSYLSIQRRLLDFAILRTMGLSRAQLVGLICFEQLTVVLLGVIAGTILGTRLGSSMMPFLELTEQGRKVLPPYAVEVDWLTVLATYAILSFVFTGAIVVIVWILNRLAVHNVLRVGNQ